MSDHTRWRVNGRRAVVPVLAAFALLASSCGSSANPRLPSGSASASNAPRQLASDWEQTVAAAKREGKVAVVGFPGNDIAEALTAGFQKTYPDIRVEFQVNPPGGASAKLVTERAAGQFLNDVYLSGARSAVADLLPTGAFDPIETRRALRRELHRVVHTLPAGNPSIHPHTPSLKVTCTRYPVTCTLYPVAIGGERMADVQREVEQFLYKEARLLDEMRLREWLELFTDDARYWMPLRPTRYTAASKAIVPVEGATVAPDVDDGLAIYDDTKQTLTQRVARLETGLAWAEDPPSRTRHLISNVEVEAAGEGEVKVNCNFVLHRARFETEADVVVGGRQDVLRKVDGNWKIASRKIVIDQPVFNAKNLSVFL